jgi:hypothetical protein
VTPDPSLEQRLARLGRAIGRAASDAPSESRQAALEGLARFSAELAAHFAAEEARERPSAHAALHARLRGDLAEIDLRARAAGDWPESWRAVATAFGRFAAALEAHERAGAGTPHET